MRILSLWRRVVQWFNHTFVPPYQTLRVEEKAPSQLKRKVLYIVHEDGFDEHAAMLCPCGCMSTIYINLIPDERPCWTLNTHQDGTASLHPSVWRKSNCTSHFLFKKGRIVWCKPGPPPNKTEYTG